MAEDNHDVFEGEIPKNLGKKQLPIWVKLGGLVLLVGGLGTVVYLFENGTLTSKEAQPYDTDAVFNVLTNHQEEIDVEAIEYPADNDVNVSPNPVPSNTDQISVSLNESPITQDSDELDMISLAEMSNPITITPPAEPVQQRQPLQQVTTIDHELRTDVNQLTNRIAEIEANESERITVIRSGIELHSQSLAKLNDLVASLASLKAELKQLKTAPAAAAPPRQPASTTTAAKKPTPNQVSAPKPKATANAPELNLVGVDTWGGERFAQIEYDGQIHLLASNEVIGKWRLHRIGKDTVTITNAEGESIELTI